MNVPIGYYGKSYLGFLHESNVDRLPEQDTDNILQYIKKIEC